MRLLMLGEDVRHADDVRNFTGVWSYYLTRELRRRGIEVAFARMLLAGRHTPQEITRYYADLDVSGCDHILALGLRYFETVPRECGEMLRKRVKGALAQLYDGGLFDDSPVDITFTFRDDSWKYPPGSPNRRHERHHQFNKYIGWAADDELCAPRQAADELRILVDHAAFNSAQRDLSLHVLINVRDFVRSGIWRERFASVRVRRFVDGAVEDLDVENFDVRPYGRAGIPYTAACAEYSQSHLFLVTHQESVGLTILETAMAGALPVVPKGYAPQDRLDTVRHFCYDGAIRWADVMAHLDVQASRAKAAENSWSAVADRMLDHLRKVE